MISIFFAFLKPFIKSYRTLKCDRVGPFIKLLDISDGFYGIQIFVNLTIFKKKLALMNMRCGAYIYYLVPYTDVCGRWIFRRLTSLLLYSVFKMPVCSDQQQQYVCGFLVKFNNWSILCADTTRQQNRSRIS